MVLASYHTREVNGDFNAKIAKTKLARGYQFFYF